LDMVCDSKRKVGLDAIHTSGSVKVEHKQEGAKALSFMQNRKDSAYSRLQGDFHAERVRPVEGVGGAVAVV